MDDRIDEAVEIAGHQEASEQQISLLDLLAILYPYRYRTLILAAVVAAGVGMYRKFLMPDVWTCSGLLVPHIASGPGRPLDLVAGSYASQSPDEVREQTEVVFSLANSTDLRRAIAASLELDKVFGVESVEVAARRLKQNLKVRANPRTARSIEYTVSSSLGKEMAVKIASAFHRELSKLIRRVNQRVLEDAVEIPQKRRAALSAQLAAAEERLKAYKKKHGIISVDDEIKKAAENRATLNLEIVRIKAEIARLGLLDDFGRGKYLREKMAVLQEYLDQVAGRSWEEFEQRIAEMKSEIAMLRKNIRVVDEYLETTNLRQAGSALMLVVVSDPSVPDKPNPKRAGVWAFGSFLASLLGMQTLVLAWYLRSRYLGNGAVARRAREIWTKRRQ